MGKEFLDGEPGVMILGDNAFCGRGFAKTLREAVTNTEAKPGNVLASGEGVLDKRWKSHLCQAPFFW